jgi:putative ABC transport system permease protein
MTWWRRRRPQADFSEEIRAHVDAETEALIADGLPRDEARTAALRKFGNVTRVEERFYESRRFAAWDALIRDLRYALATLRREPGVVAVLVACLGLGIGVNATIFGIFNAALLQEPTAIEPDRIVRIEPGNGDKISYANYRDLRDAPGFSAFALSGGATLNLQNPHASGDEIESLSAMQVSDNFFELLGVHAFRGRTFSPAESRPELRPRTVILGYGFWQRRFQGDDRIIGRALMLSGEPFTVIGVLAPGHRHGMALYVPDVYVPISPLVSAAIEDRRNPAFDLRARLAPGVTREQAQASFVTAARRLEAAYPEINQGFGRPAFVLPMSGLASLQGHGVPSELPMLLAAPFVLFGLLLLTACANVAGVLIARGESRRGEIAVRLALGASRWAVVRMLLVECLVLTTLSTAGGLMLAASVTALLGQLRFSDTLSLNVPAFSPDLTMMLWAGAVAVATCVACGLAPALQSTRVTLTPGLRNVQAGSRRSRGRKFLVIAQVAASALLLTLCLTLLRGLQQVATIDPGFDVRQGISARVTVEPRRFTQEQLHAFALRLVERLEQLPQAQSVSFASLLPLGGDNVNRRAELRGQPFENGVRVGTNQVGPRFFETLGVTVRSGREFLSTDRIGAPPVAIVNESFAKRAYPNESAIGRYIRVGERDAQPWREIVGIVSDSKYATLSEAPRPQVFVPYLQTGGGLIVQVRTRPESSPALGLSAVRSTIASIDSKVLVNVRTTEEATSLEFTLRRAATSLLAGLGAIGLLLSLVGLFGVLAWHVSRGTPEIGIRMALGASRGAVRRRVVRTGLMLVGVGAFTGIAAAVLVTWPLRWLLAGANPADPITLTSVAGVLLLTGAAASFIPAHRASRIDPAIALRSE